MAAPSKLTAALLTKLEAVTDQGWTLKAVCAHLGISDDSWRSWENRVPDEGDDLHVRFLGLAARVRAGMGSATDDMAWGVLREVAEDPALKPSDRLAAAQAILRLRIPHRVELTGKDGGAVRLDAGSALDRLDAMIAASQAKD